MACSHTLTFVTCLSNGTSLQAEHARAKLQWGGNFGVLTGLWILSAYNRAQNHHLSKATGQN